VLPRLHAVNVSVAAVSRIRNELRMWVILGVKLDIMIDKIL
jgi:hypothetical protein